MSHRSGMTSIVTAACGFALCGLALIAAVSCSKDATPSAGSGQAFATPEEAVRAFAGGIAGTGDYEKTDSILGNGSFELLRSGDDVADRADALRFKALVEKRLAFEDVDDDRKIALLGEEAWPFSIPLVRKDGKWHFDLDAGREELANRRVGRNELLTIATLHAVVDAQREYHAAGRDGKPPCYAQKVASEEGLHDGLYWPVGPGEAESPLGPEVAAASSEGYRKSEGERPPFHGYYFHILLSQGKNAPGGPREYLDANGLLTGGFAAIAWPARHGVSGMKTFVVSQRGVIYEKDLGDDTGAAAKAMKVFDPDETWDPVEGD